MKQSMVGDVISDFDQPPSGGCVLKLPRATRIKVMVAKPAAFGRLCVETSDIKYGQAVIDASRLRAAVC